MQLELKEATSINSLTILFQSHIGAIRIWVAEPAPSLFHYFNPTLVQLESRNQRHNQNFLQHFNPTLVQLELERSQML